MANELLGIAAEGKARSAYYAKRYPAHHDRIMGFKKLVEVEPRTHIIEVDCRTGTRTIHKDVPAEPEQPVDRKLLKRVMEAALRQANIERVRDMIIDPPTVTGPSTKAILEAVSSASGVSCHDIAGGSSDLRAKATVHARHLYCYVLAALRRDLSYPAMARTFAEPRHHTTVLHAVRTFKRRRRKHEVRVMCDHPAIATMLKQADANPRVAA